MNTASTKGRRRITGWGLLIGLAALSTACGPATLDVQATPIGTRTEATGPAAQSNRAGLVDIGGRRVYLQCIGTGSPTVVLVSGSPIAADLWDSALGKQPTVYQTVAGRTRVCA